MCYMLLKTNTILLIFYIKCKCLKPQREDSDQEQRALFLLYFGFFKKEHFGKI